VPRVVEGCNRAKSGKEAMRELVEGTRIGR